MGKLERIIRLVNTLGSAQKNSREMLEDNGLRPIERKREKEGSQTFNYNIVAYIIL